jgi:bacterioferritin-associated ferredoxin
MKIEPQTEICVCNSLTVEDIAQLIKEKNLQTLEDILQNSEKPIGDKCEACHFEGYNNDGLNIPMVLSMVKSGRL